ncbi:hypothetical protein ACHAWO_003610 [Cyclotella atomus]|uniref:Uncharacterized protein n=1 Tax=Cyclotella atomus TaxID=382360 RepID=A0ABD3P379_9STRA
MKSFTLGLAASLTAAASAFSAIAPTTTSIYDGLRSTPLVRASDASPILLANEWRSNTPFGIADETAVVLPATDKMFFVGVGSAQAAAEFASEMNIDPSICFGDEGGSVGDVLNLNKGMKTMWNPPAVSTMMERNDEASLKALGEAYKNAADKIGIQNLAPKNMQDTLRQGGTFVFRGADLKLEHYDEKVGDNAKIEDILAIIGK